MSRRVLLLSCLLSWCVAGLAAEPVRNVVLVTLDGVRVQEMFGGADIAVMKHLARGAPLEGNKTYQRYWAASAEERRMRVMPFLWGTLLKQHAWIAGDPAKNSHVEVTNRFHTSYPGYAEILTGRAHDDVIIDNKEQRIPASTVLEFARRELKLPQSAVAVFSSWDLTNSFAEHEPGTITVNAGFAPYATKDAGLRALSEAQGEMVAWDGSRFDYVTERFALDYLKRERPRLTYILLGDTDELAHDGRYELLLQSLRHADHFLEELWTQLQSMPQYRDNTLLIVTADHGRGKTPEYWGSHNEELEAAKNIWLVVAAPGDVRRGEIEGGPTLYQTQIAATIAQAFGLDFNQRYPEAGKPIALRGAP
ncbi:alkaline phosphatase family protein [Rudaea sp.]|uniref:alkaline phosphatase family protein n=1 Tax=Rudaea sp. TaxID=2136325 RepID=UPI002ED2FE88